jgi:hypothetical protein
MGEFTSTLMVRSASEFIIGPRFADPLARLEPWAAEHSSFETPRKSAAPQSMTEKAVSDFSRL